MSVLDTDLWPKGIFEETVITPLAIMKKQASLIGQKTQNLLEGAVISRPLTSEEAGRFRMEVQDEIDLGKGQLVLHRFVLVAPALGDLRHTLFSAVHSLELYPVAVNKTQYNCLSEEKFVKALAEILQSKETKSIIQSMISQSKA